MNPPRIVRIKSLEDLRKAELGQDVELLAFLMNGKQKSLYFGKLIGRLRNEENNTTTVRMYQKGYNNGPIIFERTYELGDHHIFNSFVFNPAKDNPKGYHERICPFLEYDPEGSRFDSVEKKEERTDCRGARKVVCRY